MLPLEDFGCHLNKQEFKDAVAIRYNWPIQRIPTTCVCGTSFDIDPAMICKKGGFVAHRHKGVRNCIAELLSEIAIDGQIKPHLIPLTGEHLRLKSANSSVEARLDISA